MSSASAAPPKPVRTSGRPRSDRADQKSQCPEADLLVEFLRSELISMRDRLGWSYRDLAKKMGYKGLASPAYRSWRGVEVMLKTGGFGTMVKIAKAMGMRVIVDLK